MTHNPNARSSLAGPARGPAQRPAAAKATAAVLAVLMLSACVGPIKGRVPRLPQGIREGDVVFQSLDGAVTQMIEGLTGSPYSHCGIVIRDHDGRLGVIEALGRVRVTPIEVWAAGGRRGRLAIYRLRPRYREDIPAIITAARAYLGRPYDIRYRMDDEYIYCSELVYKAYRDATGGKLGRLVKLAELRWQPYRKLIEELEGGVPPLDREMITPRGLAAAEQLVLVYSTFGRRYR